MSQPHVEKTVYACPSCSQRTLVEHCDNPLCTWMRCRDKERCDLQMDARKKRGHRLVPGSSRRERWAA